MRTSNRPFSFLAISQYDKTGRRFGPRSIARCGSLVSFPSAIVLVSEFRSFGMLLSTLIGPLGKRS